MSNALNDRGKSLEGAFFQQKDRELLERLRQESASEEKRIALSKSSGITDNDLLHRLVELEIEPTTFVSFSLLPLVQVAWADGTMQDSEREAILRAAEQAGVSKNSTSFEILETWMEQSPSDELYSAWKAYASTLKESLEASQVSNLQSRILGRAQEVAEAAGGFLGLGNKVSNEEATVLKELSEAF
ncbi:MAG: hypothetical protein VX438_07705 [Planctomycetota bacterium]|jgi:hypothetical protein|nr:hypothetical protein [Planctomycetota bacterium]